MTILDDLKKLDEQREKLLQKAKKEALDKAETAVAELNALGFPYQLSDGSQPPPPQPKPKREAKEPTERKGTRTPKDVPCPICNFKTMIPHDKRSHRAQQIKAPFTDAELKERGLVKVAEPKQ